MTGFLYLNQDGYRFGLCQSCDEAWRQTFPERFDRYKPVGTTNDTGWLCPGGFGHPVD